MMNSMAKAKNPEMDTFNAALRQVLSVSKTDLDLMIRADKATRADKPTRKATAASRAPRAAKTKG